ncbi:class I SAM-dependent methyltransferase [Herbaspirillum sp. RTI4]|uniref:class I SAM-dependent methyltransferase n=1 Tax=Herbaspirillum sp. RTI4 TaxID=3048640 RepID=UPI002AB45571|nr:class I SAM-dependent methyltransferase [Herbaspirillum sp. RTI4]MDY7579614.1 class I SAM-dependent methyltransferase [Herbaspirillum sp. RTI4]MEA9983556.1 class I SAM-dependent methyltransferase [Herbaspirillum sp. RTI4]
MRQAVTEEPIIDLAAWLQTPGGIYVREWEHACLNRLTADIFGFNAVQIGAPGIDALAANRMPYRFVSDATPPSASASVSQAAVTLPQALIHDFSELPFASQSLDLVILPHVLEFSAAPHQVLREVERVLIPEGQLIICGFNPLSLWGLRRSVARLTGAHFLPQGGDFIHLSRLKDWLELLDMEVGRGDYGCYAPYFATDKWLRRFHFMETVGSRWWPYLGAVHIVRAIKRVKGMRLVGPARFRQKSKARQAVPATNKVRENNKGE